MKILTKTALALLVVATAACTNPDRFGAGNSPAPMGAAGAGVGSAADPATTAYFNQTVGDRVLFAVDSSSLTEAAKAVLDGQTQWLLTNSNYRAVIEGHADEQGTREYNLALGFRRANAVREYLVSRGVPAARLEVTSYGKERPVEVCSQESCYSQNRRAVTVLAVSSFSS